METKPFEDLKPNPKNPRTISKHDFEALVSSMREFGDLSGIILNRRTGQLVGGHQRIEAFKKLGGQKQVVYQHKWEAPDKLGTVAYGYVAWDNQFFPFREVDWDITRELAANVAANRIQGEFDLQLLAEVNYMIAQEDENLLALTGQTDEEIKSLLASTGAIEPDPNQEPPAPKNIVRVECGSEEQAQQVFSEMQQRGLKVSIV